MKEITWDILQSVYMHILSRLLLKNDIIVFFDLQCHVALSDWPPDCVCMTKCCGL